MRKLYILLVCFFLCTLHVEAVTVKSVQDGNFFAPETWENNQVPNLAADSIIVKHYLSFDQDLNISGNAYLNVKFCAALCGNFNISLSQNSIIHNEGDIYADKISVQAFFLNDGRVYCQGMTVTAGKFKNDSFGYFTARQYIHDCSQKNLPETYYKLIKTPPNRVDIHLKCYAEIDFGDSSGTAYSSNTVSHLYTPGDSFTVNIKMYCSCDTVSFQENIVFPSPMPDNTKPWPVVSLYPNPNNGEFHVKFESCKPQSNVLTVPLYNSAGQRIRYVYLNQNGETQIDDLPRVASGVYYLGMPSSSGIKPQKVVIIR